MLPKGLKIEYAFYPGKKLYFVMDTTRLVNHGQNFPVLNKELNWVKFVDEKSIWNSEAEIEEAIERWSKTKPKEFAAFIARRMSGVRP